MGYSEEGLVGHLLHEVIHHSYSDGSHYPFEECPLFTTINNGSIENTVDEALWRKTGSSFPAEYTSTPIHKDSNVIGAVITFRDIAKFELAVAFGRSIRENQRRDKLRERHKSVTGPKIKGYSGGIPCFLV